MKVFTYSMLILLNLAVTWPAFAAVHIQSRDNHNEVSNIFIEGNRAHMVIPNNEGHVVMDVANNIMKAVLYRERIVVDMSEFMTDNAASTQPTRYVDTYTKTMGLGPRVIGYETEEYAMYANDEYCGSLFVSVRAMRDIGLKKFAHAFNKLSKNMDAQMSKMTGMNASDLSGPCDQAEQKTSLKLRDIGFPLKSTNRYKEMIDIITKINKNARLPANAFQIPADFKVMKPAEMMQQATKQMQNMQPQMEEMMRNMTPEMREMMRQQMQQYRR